jgi:hypothetical protein
MGSNPVRSTNQFLQSGAVVARQAHNLKVVGSNPTSATNFKNKENNP